MELDPVDPLACRIEAPQARRVLVGEAAEIEAVAGAPARAERREPLRVDIDAVGGKRPAERTVGHRQVDVDERGSLVEDLMRVHRQPCCGPAILAC